MGLLERVSMLLRANLNDLIGRAESPSTMIKQVIVDVENQLMQVKTQVAIAIADQHMLAQKQHESAAAAAEWLRKAEIAVSKGHDDLARAALERHQGAERIAENFRQQVEDQRAQVATLKTAFVDLEQKLAEVRARGEVLVAQHRRARTLGKTADAQEAVGRKSGAKAFERVRRKLADDEVERAKSDLAAGDVEERLAQLEREDEVDRLLAEIKARKQAAQ